MLKFKEIEQAKRDAPWPLSISAPIRSFNRVDKPQVEVKMEELGNWQRS
jgi:hypothetical protein